MAAGKRLRLSGFISYPVCWGLVCSWSREFGSPASSYYCVCADMFILCDPTISLHTRQLTGTWLSFHIPASSLNPSEFCCAHFFIGNGDWLTEIVSMISSKKHLSMYELINQQANLAVCVCLCVCESGEFARQVTGFLTEQVLLCVPFICQGDFIPSCSASVKCSIQKNTETASSVPQQGAGGLEFCFHPSLSCDASLI